MNNFQKNRGFTLLIAVIFMSVMLTLGLSLSSLGYKQVLLSSTSAESQYAFYTADAALECALYADQQQNLFMIPSNQPQSPPAITCDGTAPVLVSQNWSPSLWVITNRLSLDSNKHCVDVTIYKYSSPQENGITTYLFSQGYNVPCSTIANPRGARFVSRGLSSNY